MEYDRTYDFNENLDDSMCCGGCDKLATHFVAHQTYEKNSTNIYGTFTGIFSCEEHIEQAKEELATDCGAPNEDSVRIVVEALEDIKVS